MVVCLNLNSILSEILFKESVEGSVDAGNYSYYSYNGNHKIRLVLTTHLGDADLYVSQSDSSGRVVKPKFDLGEHDLQSVTCGLDIIQIDEEFRRPISIAVYGHPRHETTVFTLDVIGVDYFDDNDKNDSNIDISNEDLQFYEDFFGEPYNGLNKVPKHRTKSSNFDDNSNNRNSDNSDENRSETWTLIIDVLANILHILLETIL